MINGLTFNTYEELNGLRSIFVDELETGIISQIEINKLDGITSNIQEQFNDISSNLQNNK